MLIIATLTCMLYIGYCVNKNEVSKFTYYENEKSLSDTITITVFQTLDKHFGLGREEHNIFRPVAVIVNDSNILYDGKEIKCSKEVGTYTYTSKDSTVRTVPIFSE